MLIEPRDHAGRLAHWLCVLVVALAQASDAKPLDTLVEEVLSTSPEIAAARSEAEAAEARLQGSTLPLNNPELEAEYERTDVDTLRVGLTQTLDWHGKRAALERMARLEAQLARQRIEAVDRERKPDPTLGVAGGREGDENLFVLSFALPLQVRNRGEAEVQATRLEVVAAEQRARQIQLDVKSRLAAADARYRLLHATWARWIEEGLPSLSQRVALLERLWQAGETSTTDHLIQVQQLLDTRMAGVDFEGELRLAWIDLLEASGALGRLEQIMRK